MPSCFVIQPFDGGRFDKRYANTFQPAIEAAGPDPYANFESGSSAFLDFCSEIRMAAFGQRRPAVDQPRCTAAGSSIDQHQSKKSTFPSSRS